MMLISKRFLIFALVAAAIICIADPAFAGKDAENCRTYGDYLASYQGDCWTCKIFMLFFDTGNEVAGYIAKIIESPAKRVLGVGLGLWLVCHTAMFFSNVGDAPDVMEFLTKVGGAMFRGTFAAIFLAAGSSVAFEYFVNPILSSAASFSTAVISGVPCTTGTANAGTLSLPLGSGVRSSMECMIQQISAGMAPTQALAAALRCGSKYWIEVPVLSMDIINPIMWGWGCMMGMFFWVIGFLFPLAMLDVIFRISLIIGMLPLFVVAWVFPSTRKYAKGGWDIFFHSAMVFVIASMMISMIVAMVDATWAVATSSSIEQFRAMLESGAYVDAYDELDENGGVSNFFIVLAIAAFGIYMSPRADEFSSSLVGGQGMESCGVRAIKAIVNAVIDLIIFILSIITLGCTACLYFYKVANYVKKTHEAIKTVQKRLKRIKKMRERINKLERARKAMAKSKNYL